MTKTANQLMSAGPVEQSAPPVSRFASQRAFPVQAKLRIGRPGDRYEQEADRVAEQVIRMPDEGVGSATADNLVSPLAVQRIQRLCSKCEDEVQRQVAPEEEEEDVQRQALLEEEQEEEEAVQTKPDGGGPKNAPPAVQAEIHSLRGGGRPLAPDLRDYFEPRFRYDFSRVRVHADMRAASSAQALNARAYTSGYDIAFGTGQYSPSTGQGKHLLAHELTHVVQQNGGLGGLPSVQRRLNDGHDLTATRFSGNLVLEGAYDNERLVQRGHSGTAVRLIQESLLAQGYTLPVFGADGIFGGETETAVRRFQIDAGAEKLDGIVGPETMKLLDMHDPGGTATTGPLPSPGPVAPPPATGASFSEHPQEPFAGYDDTTAPNDSLVVPVNGRRQAQVAVTPSITVPAPVPAYVSDTPGVATVEPTPDGIAVTGVSDGTAKIESREGATVLDTLDVEVKDRLDRSVAFHYVCDSRAAAAGGPHCSNGTPAADDMRSLLNRVWERQANVRFTGGASHNIVVPGDLGPTVDSDGAGGGEMGIVTALGAGANYNVFRVWDFRSPVCGACNGGLNSGNNTLIADIACASDSLGLPHEAGHFLVLSHADGFIMNTCGARTDRRVTLALANKVNP